MKARSKPSTKFVLEAVDCVQGMRDLAEESVDIVVTSPPYNLGIKYQNYRDTRSRDEYLVWCQEWAREIKRLLKIDGSLFLNLGSAPSNPLIPHELVVELKKLFVLQNTFHWIKSITIETRRGEQISAGHFKPIHSKRFVNDCHEYIFHLTKTGDAALDRLAVGVPYFGQVEHRPVVAHKRSRRAVSRKHLVHSLPDYCQPFQAAPSPGHVPGGAG